MSVHGAARRQTPRCTGGTALLPFGYGLCYISKKVTLMPLSQDLLEMLVCPVCKEPVQLLDDQSGLKCRRCRRVYPVRDDIPVMLPEEATIAED